MSGETAVAAGKRGFGAIAAWTAVAALIGLGLRILGARGDFWQDEIWTFFLLRGVHSPLGIFLDLSADNNHFLNTLYLYAVGEAAAPLVARAFSIVLGVSTIAAVAVAMRGRPLIAQAASIAMFAAGYPLVHYGSEARGYAGLILCTVLSIHFLERELERPERSNRIWLGVSNLAGTLFQPIMVGTVAVLIGWAVWVRWRGGRGLRQALVETQQTFSISIRLLLLVLVLAVIAVYRVGGYKILNSQAFTVMRFTEGYGGMLRFLLGIPESVPGWVVLAIVLPAAALLLYVLRGRLDWRPALYALAIFGLPFALLCARLPNVSIYRYYLLPSIALLLLLADGFAAAWQRGGWARGFGVVLAGAFVLGNAVELGAFFQYGRGNYQEPLKAIAASGTPTVTGNLDGVVDNTLSFYATRLDLPVTYVPNKELCGSAAAWLIESSDAGIVPDETVTMGAPDCARHYHKEAVYPSWGLSGWTWTLYRATDP